MEKRERIVVVGSANVDFVVTSRRLPRPGETVTGGRFLTVAGGKGANQAVAAARLGADVTFVARVGNDSVGDSAISGYEQEGLRTDRIVRDPDRPTGVALILVDEKGENLISVASGANEALSIADVERAADRIRDADVLLVQLETPLPPVMRAMEIANEAGVPVILDPAPVPEGPPSVDLLRSATYLTPNESEMEALTGLPVHDEPAVRTAAEKLRGAGIPHVIVTRGAAGAVAAGPEGVVAIPGLPVATIDSTAAGDAFNAALACAIAAGRPFLEAIRVGCAAGALASLRSGAQASLPTRAELNAFLGR